MIVIENDNCIFFDVDSTLVMWPGDKGFQESTNKILIDDPNYNSNIYSSSGYPKLELVPHNKHIQYLKDAKIKNKNTIVVWSAGGWDWALNVVKALELQNYVDAVMEKPIKYVDDLPCKAFMGIRIYKDFKPND